MMRTALLIAVVVTLLTGVLPPAGAQCTVEETSVMGEPAVILENDFVRLRARPTIGGRLDELFYKPTERHLTSRSEGTVFVDRLWNYANADVYRQWMNATYTYTIDRSPERAAITMTGLGFVGPGKFMSFEKTISIEAGSSAVRADYRFSVAQDAMKPMRAGLWWHNRLGVPQETNTYYIPTREGVASASYGAGGGGQYWWYDPARGWSAVAGESGTGVAAIVDLAPLMCFYNYMGGDVAGLEWAFRSQEIPNGASVETTAWLLPFAEMGRIAGAGQRVVVGLGDAPDRLDAPGTLPLTVQVAAPRPIAGEVHLNARRLPDGEAKEVARWSVEAAPGATANHELTVDLPQAGTWELRGEVVADGERLADFFHQVIVGEASGQIAIEPNVELVGRVGERFEDKLAARGTGPEDRHPSEEVVTPHVPWGKPLAGGPVRALIINDLLTGRETVELAQRLEMVYDAPTISTSYVIGGATTGMFGQALDVDWALDNLRKLLAENRYDVIVIGGMTGELYPDDVVAAILEQVRAGAGLVWANPNKCSAELWSALPLGEMESLSRPTAAWRAEVEHYLTVGIPWNALPPTEVCRYTEADGAQVLARADRYPLVAVRDLGEGRVVALGYNTSWQGPGSYSNGLTPWIQFAPTRFAYWEYYHSLLAKAMLWAAGRVPPTRIAALTVTPADTAEGAATLTIGTANEAGATDVTAELRVVDEFGAVEQSIERDLRVPAGAGEQELALPPALPGGTHLVDIILRDAEGRSIDWGTVAFEVSPRVEITALQVEDRVYREGDTVQATVTLAGVDPLPARVTLVGTLRDAHGRLIARAEQPAAPNREATVELTVPVPLATTATLRVEVHEDATLLDAAEQTVLTMPPAWDARTWEPWLSAMWSNPAGAYSREYLARYAAARVHEMGIDAVTTSSNWLHDGEQRSNFEAGFRLLPLGIVGDVLHMNNVRGEGMVRFSGAREQYAKTGDIRWLERPYPLQAEETRALVADKVAQVTAATERYRPVGYSCGDELSVTYYVTPFDYDFSPVALEHFRTWLQGEYESLAALNAEWDTDFASWDEVMPMTAEQVRERGNYAPWADHRSFMEFSLAEFFDFTDNELERHDPGARIGISGTQAAEAYGGYDWWRLTEALDFGQTYDHQNTGIMHRSFHDFLTAPWWGYAQTGPPLSNRLWRRMLEANDGASFYTYNYLFWPDYTWTQCTSEALPVVREIQGGLARLLDACAEREADVLVHYSQPSIHGAWITGGQTVFRDNRGGWIQAIEDSGMQVSFLAYAQLEEGALTEMMPRVFLLPYSVALSDAEVAEIEAYVRAGGTVVADARIGLMDEHCRLRETGALDELFGVRRAAVEPGAPRPEGVARFTATLDECDPTGISFDGFGGEELTLTTGRALGEMAGRPAFIVNEVGQGRAVLLNLFADTYQRRRGLGVGEPMRRLLAEALELGGARAPIGVEVSGEHFVYCARFRDGDSRFVGVVRDTDEGGSEVHLTLPEPRHVYAIRTGEYLGMRDRLSTPLGPGECVLYALLPYEVTGVRVRARAASVSPGETVEFLVSVVTNGDAGLHVYDVEVSGPSGEVCPWYGTQLTAPRGVASGQFTLALDDRPGRWTIRARDVATGVTGETQITVKR